MLHDSQWERLAGMAPDDVCRRAGVEYDAAAGCYWVRLLNRRVLVNPAARRLDWGDGATEEERPPGFHVALVAVVYLLEAKEAPLAGEWVTGEMLPAGTFFFRGLHAIPTAEVARRFGEDVDGFRGAAARLGGKVVEGGDVCVELEALPRVPLRVVLWEGDEEFAARVTMLFDRTAGVHLPLDALLSLAQHVVSALVREGGAESALA